MSTLAPTPAPHHHVHLPSRRRLSQLGFLLGATAGAVTYVVGSLAAAFLVFVIVWYVVGYGVPQVAAHEAHRNQWIVHIAFVPVGAIAAATAIWLAWPHPVWSVLFGIGAAVGLQALLTRLFLRDVVDDQEHDLRKRIGLE
jgi:hypothetical protein